MKVVKTTADSRLFASNKLMRHIAMNYLKENYNLKIRYIAYNDDLLEIVLKSGSAFTANEIIEVRENLYKLFTERFSIYLAKINFKI